MYTKLVVEDDFVASGFKPGLAVGYMQHIDMGPKVQVRIGGGFSIHKIEVRDYSPMFPDDFNPATGQVDIYKSYIQNDADMIQIIIPVNLRWKLSGEARHLYIAGGFEGRVVIKDTYQSGLMESGVVYHESNSDPHFKARSPVLYGQAEWGYEFPFQKNKMNISLTGKYGLTTQFDEGNNALDAFDGIRAAYPLDIGVGIGLVF